MVPVRVLYEVGDFAARSGAVRSAPVSITAMRTEAAERRTESGTPSSCVPWYSHSSPAGLDGVTASAGSAAAPRATGRLTKRIPGARRSRAAGSSVRTSAARSAGRRRTTTAPVPCSAAARSACVR